MKLGTSGWWCNKRCVQRSEVKRSKLSALNWALFAVHCYYRRASCKKFSLGDIIWLWHLVARAWLTDELKYYNIPTVMLIGEVTVVKYELNYNCISQSIIKAGLQDVVRRTVAKCDTCNSKHPMGKKSQSLCDRFSTLGDINIYVTQL